MRSVTFVNRLTFNFKGNVLPNACLLADVDGDGKVELCVGNSHGQIAIFKGANKTPWRQFQKSNENITVITHGDLLNMGFDVLVAISADGLLWMFSDFNVSEDTQTTTTSREHGTVQVTSDNTGSSNRPPTSQRRNPPALRATFE